MELSVLRAKRIPNFGGLTFLHHSLRKAIAAMLALKDKGFEEEHEWRLVVDEDAPSRFRTGRFGILPYCPIPLCLPSEKVAFTDVYIGPHPEPGVAENALWGFLRVESTVKGLRERIRQSAIPYRY